MPTETSSLLKVIELPGKPLAKFDIAWTDDARRRFYVADRSNARVAVIDTDREEFVGALGEGLFTGAAETGATSGPNGIVVLPDIGQLWAGDGDSTIKIFDLESGELLETLDTGGTKRVDEMAYDPEDGLVLAANDQEKPPFVCLISTRPPRRIVAKVEFPEATHGLHQPVWDPEGHVFYLPVTEVRGDPAHGDIAAIDPHTGRVTARYPVEECQPAGLTMGPGRNLCIACSKGAIAAGFAPRSLIMDMSDGRVLATVREVGGTDEAWYNPGDGRYYLAAGDMVGGPVLGIIDAGINRWVANIPTGPESHSVAADSRTNHAYVALSAGPDLPQGGIGVFGEPPTHA